MFLRALALGCSVFSTLILSSAFASTLSGAVSKMNHPEKPIRDAQVTATLSGTVRSASTNAAGTYTITGLTPGVWNLKVESATCGSTFRPIFNGPASITVGQSDIVGVDFEFFTDPSKSLIIRDLSVVDDGRNTFKNLVEQMTPSGVTAASFVERWLTQFSTVSGDNSFPVTPRPLFITQLLNSWPRDAAGALDLARSPMRLLAIVNRVDLRNDPGQPVDSAGEGRFVFGVTNQNGTPLQFTVIFEYGLPISAAVSAQTWARSWNELSNQPFGPAYSLALANVVNRFIGRGTGGSRRLNGSALNQLRTNEIAFGDPWELREFKLLNSIGGTPSLRQVPTAQTPAFTFNGPGPVVNNFVGPQPFPQTTEGLVSWLRSNRQAVLNNQHIVPDQFLGGAAPNPVQAGWSLRGLLNDDQSLRHAFALKTCSGCHLSETNTNFLHIENRAVGSTARISNFLREEQTKRADALMDLVCPDPTNRTPLLRYFNPARRDSWTTTAAPPIAAGYTKFQGVLGYTMSTAGNPSETEELVDCDISDFGYGHMVATRQFCDAPHTVGSLGWVWRSNIAVRPANTFPIFRCFDPVALRHMLTTSPDCEGDRRFQPPMEMGLISSR